MKTPFTDQNGGWLALKGRAWTKDSSPKRAGCEDHQ